MKSAVLDELISKIKDSAPSMDSSQLNAVLSNALKKADLVSREEFDAQNRVLLRTRSKLTEMENKLKTIEEVLK